MSQMSSPGIEGTAPEPTQSENRLALFRNKTVDLAVFLSKK